MVQNCLRNGLATTASALAVCSRWKFPTYFCLLVISFWPDLKVRETMCTGARFE